MIERRPGYSNYCQHGPVLSAPREEGPRGRRNPCPQTRPHRQPHTVGNARGNGCLCGGHRSIVELALCSVVLVAIQSQWILYFLN